MKRRSENRRYIYFEKGWLEPFLLIISPNVSIHFYRA